jgi:hypothetical protein
MGVDLHGSAKGLLGRGRHTVGLIEDDDLVTAGWETDFVLSESLDLVPYYINASGVGRIELQDTGGVGLTQQLAGEGMDTCGLCDGSACSPMMARVIIHVGKATPQNETGDSSTT